jgi:CheY-like chemotaxis protein
MKLKRMLIADPAAETAEGIAEQCQRLADERVVVTRAEEVVAQIAKLKPEVAVVSLELSGMPAKRLIPKLCEQVSGLFVLATYRELSVPNMQQLSRLGVDEFIPQPIDILEVFRAASRRFNVPFRRHDRYNLACDVFRADGVMIGKTCDVSEGGMRMIALHPIQVGESLLVDIHVTETPLRVRCQVLNVVGTQPAPVKARVQFAQLWGPEQRRLVRYLQRQCHELVTDPL